MNLTISEISKLFPGHIQTYSGLLVDPLNMSREDINILDISHSLALSNRWTGHSRRPISIAEHCITGAINLPIANGVALSFLLHDSPEAYLSDIPKPLKRLLPQISEAETKLHDLIDIMYFVDTRSEDVHKMDYQLLEFEWDNFVNISEDKYRILEQRNQEHPVAMKFLYLRMFTFLSNLRKIELKGIAIDTSLTVIDYGFDVPKCFKRF